MNYSFYDEMDELDDILNESTDEEIFIESMEELFEEKASQLEYNIRRFKEKYNFNPKDSTIVVDGHKYKVDMKIKDPIVYVPGDKTSKGYVLKRSGTATVVGGDTVDSTPIILDKTFFTLKDDNRRHAVLQHEIGHQKMHSQNPNSPHTDKKKIASRPVNDDARDEVTDIWRRNHLEEYDKKDAHDAVMSSKPGKEVLENRKRRLAQSTATPNEQLDRNKARDAANRNLPRKDNPHMYSHINPIEIEADRYAANHSSERHMKRGLREIRKKEYAKKPLTQAKRDAIDQTIDDINSGEMNMDNNNEKDVRNAVKKWYPLNVKRLNKRDRAMYNKTAEKETRKLDEQDMREKHRQKSLDYNTRSKALKDKELRNNPSLK